MEVENNINKEYEFCEFKADISFLAKILNNVRDVIAYDKQQKQPLILKINEGFIFNIVRKALMEKDARFLISVTGESASGKTTLVQNAVKAGRATRGDLHVGVCGETGGDPKSIEFYHNVGLDYVSCSPFRVPVARLAAAQANIKNPRK